MGYALLSFALVPQETDFLWSLRGFSGMPAQRPPFGGTAPVTTVATTNGAAQAAPSLTARSRPYVSTCMGILCPRAWYCFCASEAASSLPPPASDGEEGDYEPVEEERHFPNPVLASRY